MNLSVFDLSVFVYFRRQSKIEYCNTCHFLEKKIDYFFFHSCVARDSMERDLKKYICI